MRLFFRKKCNSLGTFESCQGPMRESAIAAAQRVSACFKAHRSERCSLANLEPLYQNDARLIDRAGVVSLTESITPKHLLPFQEIPCFDPKRFLASAKPIRQIHRLATPTITPH